MLVNIFLFQFFTQFVVWVCVIVNFVYFFVTKMCKGWTNQLNIYFTYQKWKLEDKDNEITQRLISLEILHIDC